MFLKIFFPNLVNKYNFIHVLKCTTILNHFLNCEKCIVMELLPFAEYPAQDRKKGKQQKG